MNSNKTAFQSLLESRGVIGAIMDIHERLMDMEETIYEIADRLPPKPQPEKVEEEENG